jgi:hypothetical protein
MRIKKFLLAIAATALTASACGQYTNIPAQIHIAGNSDLTATITYAGSAATVKAPKLTLTGEPGSVGATFEKMTVNYNSGEISTTSFPVSFRVDSSAFTNKDGVVTPGTGTFELPVISAKVIELGRRQSVSNLSATVSLEGTDDAAWPTSLVVNVPIVFLPTSTGTTTP